MGLFGSKEQPATAPQLHLTSYFVPQEQERAFSEAHKDEDNLIHLELTEKLQLSHDTYRFTFKLPKDTYVTGLPVGGHLMFHFDDPASGETVSRKYTPISTVNEKGKVAFVIKVYQPTTEFPQGGQMSQYLANLKVGDKVQMEGPKGLLFYEGQGNFKLRSKPITKTKIGMIAGGTGITPCY